MKKETIGWVLLLSVILVTAAIFVSTPLVHAEPPTVVRLSEYSTKALKQESPQSSQIQSESEGIANPYGFQSSSDIVMPVSPMQTHVYVINNREVATEPPPRPQALDAPPSDADAVSSQVGVSVRVSVASLRLIVIDEDDSITEIWSNTTGTENDHYSLRVKEGSAQGPDHMLTQEIVAQYNQLGNDIDWKEKGRVFGTVE